MLLQSLIVPYAMNITIIIIIKPIKSTRSKIIENRYHLFSLPFLALSSVALLKESALPLSWLTPTIGTIPLSVSLGACSLTSLGSVELSVKSSQSAMIPPFLMFLLSSWRLMTLPPSAPAPVNAGFM